MTRVALIRHAATTWNQSGRLQGRTDVPLSDEGRAMAARWRRPAGFETADVLSSPLQRAKETAAVFGPAKIDDRLIETAWGAWEGQRLADLRRADTAGMAALEAQGLDIKAPDGESPREVMQRLAALFGDLAPGPPTHWILVTHKGVRRAALAMATGWTMQGAPPVKLRADQALVLELGLAGQPSPAIGVQTLIGVDPCAP